MFITTHNRLYSVNPYKDQGAVLQCQQARPLLWKGSVRHTGTWQNCAPVWLVDQEIVIFIFIIIYAWNVNWGGFYKLKFGVVRGFLQRRFLNFIVEKDSLTFSEKKGKASIWKWVKICHIGGWPCSLNNTQRPHRGAKYFTEWWACVGLTSQSRLISHTVNRCGSLEYRFQD